MEKYHPRTALRIQLGRLLLLYIASCASMLYGFMLIAEDGQCWETKIGQEMLKLTIIDLGGLRLLFFHLQGCHIDVDVGFCFFVSGFLDGPDKKTPNNFFEMRPTSDNNI